MVGGPDGSERAPRGDPNLFRRSLRQNPDRVKVAPQTDFRADNAAGRGEVHCVIKLQHVRAGSRHQRQEARGVAADVQRNRSGRGVL